MCILYHCMLEVCDFFFFDFDFIEDYGQEIAWISEETLNFGFLNKFEIVETFEVGPNVFLNYVVATRLWRPGSECGGLNRFVPHRFMCLNTWPTMSGTIRRYGLTGGSVSL